MTQDALLGIHRWAEWQVDLVKSSEHPVHIDAKHLANFIRTEFSGHVFSVKQMVRFAC